MLDEGRRGGRVGEDPPVRDLVLVVPGQRGGRAPVHGSGVHAGASCTGVAGLLATRARGQRGLVFGGPALAARTAPCQGHLFAFQGPCNQLKELISKIGILQEFLVSCFLLCKKNVKYLKMFVN